MKKLLTSLSVCFACASLALAAATSAAGGPPGAQLAATADDGRIATAAAMAHMDVASFKKAAAQDKDLKIDANGHGLYICGGIMPAAQGITVTTGTDTTQYTSAPFAVTATTAFKLHSRPGAAKVIYLDFTGHTTPSTTGWSSTTFTTPVFMLPGTTSATAQTNLNAIRDVWFRVSEDYAAWDIDVTTEPPAKTAHGQRCVIGGKYNDWLKIACGGISQIGSFGTHVLDGDDAPNFVFLDGVGYSVNGMQTAASHELGHSVGLSHMGEVAVGTTAAKGYSSGHAISGLTGIGMVGPIMGACYGVPLVQWSKGEYPNSNNTQDEIASISTYATHLVGARDDFGDTLATATVAPGNTLASGGVIADSSDVDLLKIAAGPGPLTVTGKVSYAYPDLKLALSILDSTGTAVATNYSVASMASTVTYTVPSRGTYYIKVVGVGFDPASTTWTSTGVTGTVVGNGLTGFTNYGSIGRYSLTGSWNPQPNTLPVAAITAVPTTGTRPLDVGFIGSGSTDTDGVVVAYNWNFGDTNGAGNTSSATNPHHIYLAPGTYTATLKVTDNDGGVSAPATQVITVGGSVLPNTVKIASMTASWLPTTNVEVTGQAAIQVVNQYGQPAKLAAVYVDVTGSVSGKAAARTDDNGMVYITMPKQLISSHSTYTFHVSSIVLTNYPYPAVGNTPSSASVTLTR